MSLQDPQHRTLLRQRAAQFADQVARYRRGDIDEEQFQPLRLRNGLYMQRHAHMLRVAIPYGVMSAAQLRALAHVARTFDRGAGHFTTRQNIQFNWPSLDDAPKILSYLAEVGMHAIQTSGSCIRNISCDHLAGVAADEIADPRPWCELLRRWSTLHPEFHWLPRKFKIAVSGAEEDRAVVRLHDIGLRLRRPGGHLRFRVYVGGGMGRTPVIGQVLREAVAPADLLGYLQSILRVYNRYGRRDNKYRARIKILVGDLGIATFRRKVEQDWRRSRATAPRPSAADRAQARRQFAKPLGAPRSAMKSAPRGAAASTPRSAGIPIAEPPFMGWYAHNTTRHRHDDYRIVHVSLKAPQLPPGDMTAAQMEGLADLAEGYSEHEIRVTHEQNLVLPYVRKTDLFTVWRTLGELGLGTANIGTLTDMICCPGMDYCSLAHAATLPIAEQIQRRMADLQHLYDIGELKLKMSGCINACGHHHAGHIGILGVDKKGKEWYQFTLGGDAGNDTRLGQRLGPAIPREGVVTAVERLVEVYLERRQPGERFIETVMRLGVAPFRERVYAADHGESSDHPESVAA